jgi:hypothetical protein
MPDGKRCAFTGYRFQMNLVRIVASGTLTLAFAAGLMWGFGHISFSDSMAQAYARFGEALGFHGDEALEDLYLYATLSISFLLAALLVWRLNGALRRHSPQSK